jgi:hypothetical protein
MVGGIATCARGMNGDCARACCGRRAGIAAFFAGRAGSGSGGRIAAGLGTTGFFLFASFAFLTTDDSAPMPQMIKKITAPRIFTPLESSARMIGA